MKETESVPGLTHREMEVLQTPRNLRNLTNLKLKRKDKNVKQRSTLLKRRKLNRKQKGNRERKIRRRMMHSGKSCERALRLGYVWGPTRKLVVPRTSPSLLQALSKLNALISKAITIDDKLRSMYLRCNTSGTLAAWVHWRLKFIVVYMIDIHMFFHANC